MVEHISRYDRFARAAAAEGLLVVGMDFIGHGDSAEDPDDLGHTGVRLSGGRNPLVEDVHTLRQHTQEQWPGVPYVIFGHSMGSFVVRSYLARHGRGLDGAIICGTGTLDPVMGGVAGILLALIGVGRAPRHRSSLFAAASLGAYNKPFEKHGARTGFDWLSRDPEQVDAYVDDPRCGGIFTLAADRVLMDVIGQANSPATYRDTPHSLPLLLLSGGADPVGAMGTGAAAVAERYRRAGATDVTLRLYPQARHELLNELNRDEVTQDIFGWLRRIGIPSIPDNA